MDGGGCRSFIIRSLGVGGLVLREFVVGAQNLIAVVVGGFSCKLGHTLLYFLLDRNESVFGVFSLPYSRTARQAPSRSSHYCTELLLVGWFCAREGAPWMK